MNKDEKKIAVKKLNDIFSKSKCLVISHYNGLDAAQMTDLRRRMRSSNVEFYVTKNTLAKLALKNTPYENLHDFFKGPTAVAVSEDPVSNIKVISKYAEENEKFKVITGSVESKILTEDEMKVMSKLPSMEELKSGIVSYLVAPHREVMATIEAPGTEIVRVLDAYSKKNTAA